MYIDLHNNATRHICVKPSCRLSHSYVQAILPSRSCLILLVAQDNRSEPMRVVRKPCSPSRWQYERAIGRRYDLLYNKEGRASADIACSVFVNSGIITPTTRFTLPVLKGRGRTWLLEQGTSSALADMIVLIELK